MPTVNGITYHNKLGFSDVLTRHYERACRATSHKDMDAYAQRIMAQWNSDSSRIVEANYGGCVTNPKYGNTGDARYGSLEFIDWFMTQLRLMGVGWFRDWGVVPRYRYDLELQDQGSPLVVTEDMDWSALDLVVQRCEEYGIQFIMTIPWPWTYGWGSSFSWLNLGPKSMSNVLNNWLLPLTTFLADRYADKYDFVQIDPANEHGTCGFNIFESAFIQAAIYDAVKAVAPNMRVNLTSCEWGSYSTLLGALDTNGTLNKFDGHAKIHCYPVANGYETYGYHYWPVTEVTDLWNLLNTYGRGDVQIRIDEFWGNGTEAIPGYDFGRTHPLPQAKIDLRNNLIDSFMTQSASLPRLDGMCIWRLLGYNNQSGSSLGFDVGATWEGIVVGFTSTFPPSDTSTTVYDHILGFGLYNGVFTKHNRRESVVYPKNTLVTLLEADDSPVTPTAIYYSWDNPDPTTEYTSPFALQRGTLYWRGADSNGNLEPINSAAFMVEGTYTVDGKEITTKDLNGNQVTSGRIGQS